MPQTFETPYGTLMPRSSAPEARRRDTPALSFFGDGHLKAIDLDHQYPIETPLGLILAERLSFYPDGSLHRLFPLNGKISGYWSEQDEAALLNPSEFHLFGKTYSAKLISLCLYPEGTLKSATLWPGETLTLPTPFGAVRVRFGFALYPDGRLRSLEPFTPTVVPTPAGKLLAYDADANAINGDVNSLHFTPKGQISQLSTTSGLRLKNGQTILPQVKNDEINPEYRVLDPLVLGFTDIGFTVLSDPLLPEFSLQDVDDVILKAREILAEGTLGRQA